MSGQSRLTFWILALVQCVLWFIFAEISQEFVYGINHGQRPLLPILGVMALAFVLYLFCVFLFWNEKKWLKSWHILLVAVVMRVPLIFWSNPVQEIDYYRYIWDGKALVAGVSPYRFSPADLDKTSGQAEEDRPEDAAKLIGIIESSSAIKIAFRRIDHREVPTIYPPASQLVFAIAAFITPEQASIRTHLVMIRWIMSFLDLGIVILLLSFLKRRQLPLGRVIVYAWCPLILKEFSNSAHMDVIAIFLVTAAWLVLVGARSKKMEWPGGKVVLSAVLWSGAVLAKWYPLVLAPLLLSFGWKKWRWRFALPVLAALLVIGTGVQLSRIDAKNTVEESAEHDELTGLRTFFTRWEMNDFVFSLLRENLSIRNAKKTSGLQKRDSWYVIVSKEFRHDWNSSFRNIAARIGLEKAGSDPAFLTVQIFAALIISGVVLWLSLRPWPDETMGEELARRIFLILAVSWYVMATQNPWYWAWALPFVVFAKSRLWLLVSGVSLIYYLRFWLIYQYPSPIWRGLDGEQIFDDIVVWLEHLPILLLLLFSGIISRVHASNRKRSVGIPANSH